MLPCPSPVWKQRELKGKPPWKETEAEAVYCSQEERLGFRMKQLQNNQQQTPMERYII